MKAIFVCFDTLNRRMLPPYGGDWVHAPNFSRLAARSVTFDNAYVGSMPCMPARRELHTGRYNFLHRSWGPIEPFDESMPEILTRHGVYTHIVTDHSHYWEDGGATYLPRYRTYEMVRGQEGDAWKGQVAEPEIPESLRKMRGELWREDWVNRGHIHSEEDMPQRHVFDLGADFIRANSGDDNWFLQIEAFDPHEPFFTQQQYKDLYPHDYTGPFVDWPDYMPVTESPEQIEHIRLQYAALLSMCDNYLGKVLDLMDELNLWDDTLLMVGTDHGFLLGEHDWWGKNMQPWYNEVAQIPLFVWDPRSKVQGERRKSLVQWIDFAPTFLEYFGAPIPETMQGAPIRERIAAETSARPAGLFGIFGGHVNVTDGRYVYMRAPVDAGNTPLFEYTLMPTRMRGLFSVAELQNIQLAEPFSFTQGVSTLKIPARAYLSAHRFGTLLFDLHQDPEQAHPLVDPEVERTMLALLLDWMRWNDAPAEQYERLGLPASGPASDEHLRLASDYARIAETAAKQAAPSYSGPGADYLKQPLKDLFALPGAQDIISQHFPAMVNNPMLKMMESASLLQITGFAPAIFAPDRLAALAADLADHVESGLTEVSAAIASDEALR